MPSRAAPGGSGFAPAPFVPALLKAAHEGVLLLAGLSAACLGSRFRGRAAAHGGEVNTAAHHYEAQHSNKDILESDTHEQQEDAGQGAEDANHHVPRGP